MKKPSFPGAVAPLAVIGCTLALTPSLKAYVTGSDLPWVVEGYDKNAVGEVFLPDGTPGMITGGYGVSGTYTRLGNYYSGAIRIEEGGIPFSTYASTAGRHLQMRGRDNATGLSIMVDGGKAAGDIVTDIYDKLYCSYLIRFTQVTSALGGRAEVRISGNSAVALQIAADGTGNGITQTAGDIQPVINYLNPVAATANTPAFYPWIGTTTKLTRPNPAAPLEKDRYPVYMFIGRFDQVGNTLGAQTAGSWTISTNSLTVASAAGITVGMNAAGTGIPDGATVIGINGTTIILDRTVTATAPTATPVVFRTIASDPTVTRSLTWAAGATSLTISSTTGIVANQVVSGTGITPGTRVTTISGTTVNLSQAVTAAATSGTTVAFRNVSPITASWTNGSNTITLSRNPTAHIDSFDEGYVRAVRVGMYITGAGIPAGTRVIGTNNDPYAPEEYKTITLSANTTAAGAAGTPIVVYSRTANATLYALTADQYDNFIARGGSDSVLDNATIGTGVTTATTSPAQISARIVSPLITGASGNASIEYGHGRRIDVVTGGTGTSLTGTGAQMFDLDEIRYGATLKAVTNPVSFQTPVIAEAAVDRGDDLYSGHYDAGYGWKSGWMELEETVSPQGAYGFTNTFGSPMLSGTGSYIGIQARKDTSVDQGVRRRPDPVVIDMSQPYTVSFDYQMEGGTPVFNTFADRIQIGADGPAGAGTNFSANPADTNVTTWLVGVVGGGETTRPMPNARKWYFFDYDPDVFLDLTSGRTWFVNGNMRDTGIALDEFSVYSFKIEVDAINYRYNATITRRNKGGGGTPTTVTMNNLRFRVNGAAHSLFWGISKPAGDDRAFGIDNVVVSRGVNFYNSWMASYASINAAADKLRGADPDADGAKNFLEYALDGNPASGVAGGKIRNAVTNISGANYQTITLPVRAGMTFSSTSGPQVSNITANEGIGYTIQGSYDLANWTGSVVEVTPALSSGLPPLSTTTGAYVYRTFRLSQTMAAQPKGFLRAVVTNTQ